MTDTIMDSWTRAVHGYDVVDPNSIDKPIIDTSISGQASDPFIGKPSKRTARKQPIFGAFASHLPTSVTQ